MAENTVNLLDTEFLRENDMLRTTGSMFNMKNLILPVHERTHTLSA